MKGKWIVQKCKKRSTKWIAWRSKARNKTFYIFNTWFEAFIYASLQAGVDLALDKLKITKLYG